MNNFENLGLKAEIAEVLEKMGITVPTPIQEQSIPALLEETPIDFIGLAQTGTGKTAAFGLPLVQRIRVDFKHTQALIMAPTRELSQQTAKQLVAFSDNNRHLRTEVVYGGASITQQIKALSKPPQILVATPGRLLDLINRRVVELEHIKYVVLDEADEMLNMGFKEDIDEILSYTPKGRVTWLFSATMPADIRRLVKTYMQNPREVSVMQKDMTNTDIEHRYIVSSVANKISITRRFLDINPEMRAIMFCRTKRETQQICDSLLEMGYVVEALHGDLSQNQRDMVMSKFKKRGMQLLLATDVAARGIDVDNLTHVFHHSLPDQLESYTHRSGRTGRAGKKGISISLISNRDVKRIKELEHRIKVKFEPMDIPSGEDVVNNRMKKWAERIMEQPENSMAESIYKNLEQVWDETSAKEILYKVIGFELGKFNVTDIAQDKNAGATGHDAYRTAGFNRFFINVGKMDDFDKTELINFIAEFGRISQNDVSNVSVQQNCAYFDIPANVDPSFAHNFKGLDIEGRGIRVNRDDDQGPARDKGGSGKRKDGKYASKGGGDYKKDKGGYGGGGGGKKYESQSYGKKKSRY